MANTQTLRQKRYFDQEYFERLIYNKRAIEIVEEKRKRRNSVLNIAMLMTCVILIVYFVISFFITLSCRLSLVYGQRKINSLEATLEQKKSVNALIEDEINHMVDEEYVRKTAIMKLSMYVPSEKDIIYFDKSNNSYVRHYDNVN